MKRKKTKRQLKAENQASARRCDWEITQAEQRFKRDVEDLALAHETLLLILKMKSSWDVGPLHAERTHHDIHMGGNTSDGIPLSYKVETGHKRKVPHYALHRRFGYSRADQWVHLLTTTDLDKVFETMQADLISERIKEVG